MASRSVLMKMLPGRHINIPGLGLLFPGIEFECPASFEVGGTHTSPESLIQAKLAEIVNDGVVRDKESVIRGRHKAEAASS